MWIRGVNIAGWLLADRMITPYLFALNSCQLDGEFCFYPDQLSAPDPNSPQHKYCDLFFCKPHLIDSHYPTDEESLLNSFSNKAVAKEYMTHHWDHFITKQDVKFLADNGVEYVKIPIPYYAMNDIADGEPFVDGQWMYFIRFVGWARQYGIKVWIDMHTTLGTQSEFDLLAEEESNACQHWINDPKKVNRSMKAIKDMAQSVMNDNLRDVVTGFGILSEPFSNCPVDQVKKYSNEALTAVRQIMGDDTAVYMSDSTDAASWNNGWWTDGNVYDQTYIDSHYFQVFSQEERALSPKQHIAYTCAKFARDTASCCYEDAPKNSKVSSGVSRIVGEWSAAYDILPTEMTNKVMEAIRDPKIQHAILSDRKLSRERQEFLKSYVKAQMVAYESADTGVSSGWFFWTLKTEGGAFAEWDYMRGVKEGWIDRMPSNDTDSASLYGSCQSIVAGTKDSMSIVKPFPDAKQTTSKLGTPIDDDFVTSRGKSKLKTAAVTKNTRGKNNRGFAKENRKSGKTHWFRFFFLCFFGYGIWSVFLKNRYSRFGTQYSYSPVQMRI